MRAYIIHTPPVIKTLCSPMRCRLLLQVAMYKACGGREAPNGDPGWMRLLIELALSAFALDGGALYFESASKVAAYVEQSGG